MRALNHIGLFTKLMLLSTLLVVLGVGAGIATTLVVADRMSRASLGLDPG